MGTLARVPSEVFTIEKLDEDGAGEASLAERLAGENRTLTVQSRSLKAISSTSWSSAQAEVAREEGMHNQSEYSRSRRDSSCRRLASGSKGGRSCKHQPSKRSPRPTKDLQSRDSEKAVMQDPQQQPKQKMMTPPRIKSSGHQEELWLEVARSLSS